MRILSFSIAMLALQWTMAQSTTTAGDHLKAFWQSMAGSDSYRVSVQVSRIHRASGKVVGGGHAKSFKKGDLFRSEIDDQSSLLTDKHVIFVDPISKIIVVQDRDRSGEQAPSAANDPLAQWAQFMKDQKETVERWKVVSTTATEVTLSSPPQQAPYQAVRITLRLRDHLPVRIEYDLVPSEELDFDRVRLEYQEMEVNCAFPSDTFSEKRYVRQEGKRLVPAPAYKDHEVQYAPGS